VRPHGLELVLERRVGREPRLRGVLLRVGLGGRRRRLPALGQVRLGRGGARLGLLQLGGEPLGPAGQLAALGLGRLPAPARRLGLAP
jgi:hypothetical protein